MNLKAHGTFGVIALNPLRIFPKMSISLTLQTKRLTPSRTFKITNQIGKEVKYLTPKKKVVDMEEDLEELNEEIQEKEWNENQENEEK